MKQRFTPADAGWLLLFWFLASCVAFTLKALAAGVMLEGRRTWPARIEDVKRGATITQFHIIIHEGRNRQIRRMVEAVGGEVVHLKRVRVGAIALGDLMEGQWRGLTPEEIAAMRP